MPAQMKRPAAAKVSGEAQAKKRQEDPISAKCATVIIALSTAEGYPDVALQMLQAAAKACLTAPKGSRTEVQKSVIEMIGEVLNSVRNGHIAKADALHNKVAEAEAEKKDRQAAADAAVATQKDKSDELEPAERALAGASVTTGAARKALKDAVSEQSSGDAELLKAGEKKASAEKAAVEDVSLLIGGTSADIGTSVKAAAKVGKDLGFEAQLIQLAEVAFPKAPTERGNFDAMIVQQFATQLSQAIAKLADQLTNGESEKAQRAGKVDDCSKQVDAAVVHESACQERLREAKASLKEAEAASKSANKSVEDFGWEVVEVVANAEAADARLAACTADLATFVELVEGSQVAPATAPAEAMDVEAAPVADADVAPASTLDAAAAGALPADVADVGVAPVAGVDAASAAGPDTVAAP